MEPPGCIIRLPDWAATSTVSLKGRSVRSRDCTLACSRPVPVPVEPHLPGSSARLPLPGLPHPGPTIEFDLTCLTTFQAKIVLPILRWENGQLPPAGCHGLAGAGRSPAPCSPTDFTLQFVIQSKLQDRGFVRESARHHIITGSNTIRKVNYLQLLFTFTIGQLPPNADMESALKACCM